MSFGSIPSNFYVFNSWLESEITVSGQYYSSYKTTAWHDIVLAYNSNNVASGYDIFRFKLNNSETNKWVSFNYVYTPQYTNLREIQISTDVNQYNYYYLPYNGFSTAKQIAFRDCKTDIGEVANNLAVILYKQNTDGAVSSITYYLNLSFTGYYRIKAIGVYI